MYTSCFTLYAEICTCVRISKLTQIKPLLIFHHCDWLQGSPELRALAAKLEQAYINKERAAQVSGRGEGCSGEW